MLDFDDMLRELRENEEFRNAVRREIITEELLKLPALVYGMQIQISDLQVQMSDMQVKMGDMQVQMGDMQAQLNDQQAQINDLRTQMEARFIAIETRIDSIQSQMDDMQQQIGDLHEQIYGLGTRVERLEDKVDRLEVKVEGMDRRLYKIRGQLLESRMADKLRPQITRRFQVRNVYGVWPYMQAVASRAEQFEGQFNSSSDISEEDMIRLLATDLVMRSIRHSDGSTLRFACEASGIIHHNDIVRAKHSAGALVRLFGEEAVPVVYGYEISDRNMEIAENMDVTVIIAPDDD